MADEHDQHRACVSAWMNGAARDGTPDQLVSLFERAFVAMWQRAQVTLGDVTLAAIVDRVVYTASRRFPALKAIEVEPSGVRFDELKTHLDGLDRQELAQAVQFAVVEFLTVLGHLTAEILTPALHAELLRVSLDDSAEAAHEQQAKLETTQKKLVRSE